MKQERSRNEKIFIWFIFIFSAIALLDCFFFLEFWYATRNGLEDGFHILNTDYSVFYWFSHISYLSCLFVVIWSGWEVVGIYIPKYRPRFIFRFFALFWITLTMVGESVVLPEMMEPRWNNMMEAIFNDGAWTGVDGFWYSFLDFFQFISIHITIPLMSIAYSLIYKNDDISKKEISIGTIAMASFMLIWFFYCGFLTLAGMKGPYPIIDWTPDGENDWAIHIQIICCILGLVLLTTLTYVTLRKVHTNYEVQVEETIEVY